MSRGQAVQAARRLLTTLFEAAVAAAHPDRCLPPHLPPLPQKGRLVLLACGKAAAAMARVALAHYDPTGELARRGRLVGVVTTRYGYGLDTQALPLLEAGHPVPDENSLRAAERALALARQARAEDMVLVLLSGGASALWCAPVPGLTLEDMTTLTRALLHSGADIATINSFRRAADRIKGGRLALAAHPAQVVTVAISDVVGDDPRIIGSGPTVGEDAPPPAYDTLARRLDLPVRGTVLSALSPPPQHGQAFRKDRYICAANSGTALHAAANRARDMGLAAHILEDHGLQFTGTTTQVVAQHMAFLHGLGDRHGLGDSSRPLVLLSGGEATVALPNSAGRGGPNQQLALELALALDGRAGIAALCADTDGTDGGCGRPEDPAGAFIDSTTLRRAYALGLDPKAHLASCDSTPFFAALDDLLITGPTHTNVNDFRAIVVDREHSLC